MFGLEITKVLLVSKYLNKIIKVLKAKLVTFNLSMLHKSLNIKADYL